FTPTAAECAERMDIAVSRPCPVAKLYAKFEGGARRRHEIGFVDSEPFVEAANLGQRGFAHTDDSDRLGLDEMHIGATRKQFGQGRSSHPARGSSTDDDDLQP